MNIALWIIGIVVYLYLCAFVGVAMGCITNDRRRSPWNWRLLTLRYGLYMDWRDEHHPDWWRY
jgi:hypothetical protein